MGLTATGDTALSRELCLWEAAFSLVFQVDKDKVWKYFIGWQPGLFNLAALWMKPYLVDWTLSLFTQTILKQILRKEVLTTGCTHHFFTETLVFQLWPIVQARYCLLPNLSKNGTCYALIWQKLYYMKPQCAGSVSYHHPCEAEAAKGMAFIRPAFLVGIVSKFWSPEKSP